MIKASKLGIHTSRSGDENENSQTSRADHLSKGCYTHAAVHTNF